MSHDQPTKICARCGIDFRPRTGRQRTRYFCSPECYRQRGRPTQTFMCGHCRQPFRRSGRTRYFCSTRCYHQSHAKSAKESFAQFVITSTEPDACYDWSGYVTRDGSAMFHLNGSRCRASRAAWILAYGPIPDGLFVCHRCDNGRCSRLDHLFLGTHQDNMDDAVSKQRMPRGNRNRLSRLSEDDVRIIQASPDTQRKLAESFGVSQSLISRIRSGSRRRYVKPPSPSTP